jgi:hypothetical protein
MPPPHPFWHNGHDGDDGTRSAGYGFLRADAFPGVDPSEATRFRGGSLRTDALREVRGVPLSRWYALRGWAVKARADTSGLRPPVSIIFYHSSFIFP